ncbi:hypothetical protein HII36_00040 [Nonomuraea sp. NN258]|uniref:hypothetical protein n=1 Tax=Nonomuraea antri TaxID=2730852 RepID=UPI0015684272|nr:hypothetical protein [Nonomuraea antri]NRQ30233.1 hypothetical protein [Nonomuraea antri]
MVLLSVVALASCGMLYRRARRKLPVLHCFQRGVILRESGGRLCGYVWSEVDVEIRKTETDLPPWGTAEPDMFLRSKHDGKLLASVRDPDKKKQLTELMAG